MYWGEEIRERVKRLRIGDRVRSDHHSLEVWIKRDESRRKEKGKKYRSSRGIWDEESRRMGMGWEGVGWEW